MALRGVSSKLARDFSTTAEGGRLARAIRERGQPERRCREWLSGAVSNPLKADRDDRIADYWNRLQFKQH